MAIKYAVFNPLNGEYTKVDSELERDALITVTALNFLLHHTHGVSYSEVKVNDDGSETWLPPKPTVASFDDLESEQLEAPQG